MEERCARTHPIFVADLHDARDGGNTNGKCVHKEDVQRGRVQACFSRETRYHVGGSSTPAISYLRKRLGKWGVEPKLLHDFVQPRKRKKSICFFLLHKGPIDGWRAPKGCSWVGSQRQNGALLFRARPTVRACSVTWKIVRNVDGEEGRNDIYPLPSSPRFYVRSVTLHGTPSATSSCRTPTDVRRRRSLAVRSVVFLNGPRCFSDAVKIMIF